MRGKYVSTLGGGGEGGQDQSVSACSPVFTLHTPANPPTQ